MVAHLTAVASPTLLNEFIFGYSSDHIILSNQGYWQRPSSMTMTGLFNNGFGGALPGISLCCNAEDNGGNSIGEDIGFVNPLNPNYNANPIYTFRDYMSKIIGTHNLTFGADFIAYQKERTKRGDRRLSPRVFDIQHLLGGHHGQCPGGYVYGEHRELPTAQPGVEVL